MNNFQLRTQKCPYISTQPGICKNNNEEKRIVEYNVSSGFTALVGGRGTSVQWYFPLWLLQRIFPGFWKNVSVYNHTQNLTDDTSIFCHVVHVLTFHWAIFASAISRCNTFPISIICCLLCKSFRTERSKRVLSVKVQWKWFPSNATTSESIFHFNIRQRLQSAASWNARYKRLSAARAWAVSSSSARVRS